MRAALHNPVPDTGQRDGAPSGLPAASPDFSGLPADVMLDVRDVSKIYRVFAKPSDRLRQAWWGRARSYHREFTALRGVSLRLRRGESMGIIGRNGSGKSTLLQIIAGTLEPTSGEALVRGRVAALLELGSGFNMEFSGRENVLLNGALLGMSEAEVAARFDEIAAFADIGEFMDQPVKTYSTGMVVRLAFAVQVILEPNLLIVDEALAVGDASFQRKCYHRLDQLKQRGVSLLFVSHSLELVRTLCDSALYLEHGRAKAQGSAMEVCDAYFQDLLAEQVGATAGAGLAAGEQPPGAAPDGQPAGHHVIDRYDACAPGGATIQGSLDIEIVQAVLAAADPAARRLVEGDRLVMTLTIRLNRPVPHFMFGVMLRDRIGSEIFGFSKYDSDLGLPPHLKPGDLLTLEVEIGLDLRPDHYFITLGMQSPGFNDVYFYGHDLLKFELEAPDARDPLVIGGVARLAHEVRATLRPGANLEQAV